MLGELGETEGNGTRRWRGLLEPVGGVGLAGGLGGSLGARGRLLGLLSTIMFQNRRGGAVQETGSTEIGNRKVNTPECHFQDVKSIVYASVFRFPILFEMSEFYPVRGFQARDLLQDLLGECRGDPIIIL